MYANLFAIDSAIVNIVLEYRFMSIPGGYFPAMPSDRWSLVKLVQPKLSQSSQWSDMSSNDSSQLLTLLTSRSIRQ